MPDRTQVTGDPPPEGPVRELDPAQAGPEHVHAVPPDVDPDVEPAFKLEPLSGPTEASEETPPPEE